MASSSSTSSSTALPRVTLFEAIEKHDPESTAVIHSLSRRSFKYGGLLGDVARASQKLKDEAKGADLSGQRIAFLVENGYDYVVTLLSILASDAIAVPLSPGFPANELRYILDNSEALLFLSSAKFRDKAEEVMKEGLEKKPILVAVEKHQGGDVASSKDITLEEAKSPKSGAMLYTSGTTSRPKGVLLPQSVLTAQAESLHQAWQYSPKDHLLHVLPLHHIHGILNCCITPLLAGSTVEYMFPFNVNTVWERLGAPFLETNGESKSSKDKITFLSVVPTIYNRFLSSHSALSPELQAATKVAMKPENLRVNFSGSAALPTPTKAAWTELSGGNVLLERYGMTEVGMALSCGLSFEDRVDGSVGWALPSVEARLVDSETNEVIPEGQDVDENGKEREGEIQLRGPTIFQEYWHNEKATAEEFVEGDDGKGRWFKTGDVASRKVVEGAGKSGQEWAKGPMYFIKGRKSVDIIKTGGEKVSALEIEREMLSLPQISEVAVVALPSEQWGQKVAAVVVLDPEHAQTGKGGKTWGVMDMRRALKDKLANYKIPQELKVLENGMPRNAMGKINKKALVKEVFPDAG
ncbi:hypothetical protein MMC25_006411 [Agyrium rufum]|nr:hypothetical protein [Agyrium rufum]